LSEGGAGDDGSSGHSPVGAARAESDDDDANDARRREELDGNFMKFFFSRFVGRIK
jgi:hypothetical protein